VAIVVRFIAFEHTAKSNHLGLELRCKPRTLFCVGFKEPAQVHLLDCLGRAAKDFLRPAARVNQLV
jgi:hypothetical protein